MVEHRTEDYALGFSKSPAVGINQRIDIHAVLITQMKLLPVDEIQQLSLTGQFTWLGEWMYTAPEFNSSWTWIWVPIHTVWIFFTVFI